MGTTFFYQEIWSFIDITIRTEAWMRWWSWARRWWQGFSENLQRSKHIFWWYYIHDSCTECWKQRFCNVHIEQVFVFDIISSAAWPVGGTRATFENRTRISRATDINKDLTHTGDNTFPMIGLFFAFDIIGTVWLQWRRKTRMYAAVEIGETQMQTLHNWQEQLDSFLWFFDMFLCPYGIGLPA